MSRPEIRVPGDTWPGGGDHRGHTITGGNVAVVVDDDGWGHDVIMCHCSCGEEWWGDNEEELK
jgi:hypothetical protein